ncbi:MAG TPA: tRNA (adenosine(37)-N6)-threonylcarbamoyltransferase complex dimerization subunit type 1 TsaB [Gammaproteobacteria bacterium]
MTTLLALETATEACSAALLVDAQVIERYAIAPRDHARLILPMIDELLAEAGVPRSAIDAVAFGRGPGSFTGLRVAAATAQGLAFGLDRPVLPVSSLAALAQQGADEGHSHILAALDARMQEVYWGAFVTGGDGLVIAHGDERLLPPEQVAPPEGAGWFGVGSGWGAYPESLQARLGDRLAGSEAERYPRAACVARLAAPLFAAGGGLPAEQALPVYLRDEVAHK